MTIGPAPDWTEVTWLVGNFNGKPTLVAVDEPGNIIAVMKGEGPAGLITLKTDSEGRLIAILTDPEDVWGVFKHMGLAELAARLGAPIFFDRRGSVTWFESFEGGLHRIDPQVGGAPIRPVLTTERARSGSYSMKWSLGPDAADLGRIYAVVPYVATGKIGFEVSFTVHADLDYLLFYFGFNTEGTSRNFRVRYDHTNSKLQYRPAVGADVDFGSATALSTDDRLFHTMKLVIDMEADTYYRFLLDDLSPTIPEVATAVDTNSYQKAIFCMITAVPVDTKSPIIYVDDLVLTIMEPKNPEE